MTTESHEFSLHARQWAFRALNFRTLSSDCSYRSSDATWLLGTIAEAGYQLPADQVNAAQIVTRSSSLAKCASIGARAENAGQYDEKCQDLAEFKSAFFDLTCGARSRRWESLSKTCAAFPDLISQLVRLKPGLECDFPSKTEDSRQQHMLQICRDVFLASPPTAARMRRRFCNEWRADPNVWEQVVDDLLLVDGEFLKTIAPWVDAFGDDLFHETSLNRVIRPPVDPPYARSDRAPTLNPTASESTWPGWVVVLGFIAIVVLRAIADHPSRKEAPQYHSPVTSPRAAHRLEPARPRDEQERIREQLNQILHRKSSSDQHRKDQKSALPIGEI
jgi:hypothetical protein